MPYAGPYATGCLQSFDHRGLWATCATAIWDFKRSPPVSHYLLMNHIGVILTLSHPDEGCDTRARPLATGRRPPFAEPHQALNEAGLPNGNHCVTCCFATSVRHHSRAPISPENSFPLVPAPPLPG